MSIDESPTTVANLVAVIGDEDEVQVSLQVMPSAHVNRNGDGLTLFVDREAGGQELVAEIALSPSDVVRLIVLLGGRP